ncbi:MAG TPA: hypothetical protein VGK32_24015 [Vicinamibacterales bacterium]|jgi:hypothetical protein
MTTQGDPLGEVFVSIQLNSNRPDHFRDFLSSVEETASCPSAVEVLVHIDEGDKAMERAVVEEAACRALRIRYLKTDIVRSFFDLWKPLNLLLPMTAPTAYFVFNSSDEFRFLTQGWDDVLRKYVGYYDDHIFRIRASRFRYRNYTDVWECGCAPDSLAFYTTRWLAIVGDWNPCLGPDSFQQCVAFYLNTSDPFDVNEENRDIPEPFLRFSGEGASLGLEGDARRRRVHGHIRESLVLWSHRVQTEAKRRAMLLLANIWAGRRGLPESTIVEDRRRQMIVVRDPVLDRRREFPYRVSRIATAIRNNSRKLRYGVYAGGGRDAARGTRIAGLVYYLDYRAPRLAARVDRVLSWLSRQYLASVATNLDLRRQMRALTAYTRRNQTEYYIYGTGEYSRRLCRFITDARLQPPVAVLEMRSILDQKKARTEFMGLPLLCDADVIPRLSSAPFVIIGSPVYHKEIAARLKQQGCQAKLIDLSGWSS